MLRLIWLTVVVSMLLCGCGVGTPTRSNDFTPPTSIEISADSQSIAFGTSTRLTAKGIFPDVGPRDITNRVTWSSDTPAVAEFSNAALPNRIISKTPGTATLHATLQGVSATFNLTVTSATVTTVTITPVTTITPSLSKGLTAQFTATGTFSDSTTQDLTFDAVWASDAPDVATISNDIGSKGLAQARTVGTANITATFDNVSSAPINLIVTEPVLQSITVTPVDTALPANPSVLSLSTVSFKATGNFSDNTTQDLTSQVTWSSSQSTIASIDASGKATTLAQGTTTITATLPSVPDVPGTTNLKVTGGNLRGITLAPLNSSFNTDPLNASLVNGTQVQITANGSFDNGTTRDITAAVVWSVADPNVATISLNPPTGKLAFLQTLATTTIPIPVKATFGTVVSSDTKLTVKAPTLSPSGLAIKLVSEVQPDLTVGTSARYSLIASYDDGTKQDVTASDGVLWKSTSGATASVDNSGPATRGLVTGVAAGTVTISADFGGQTTTQANSVTFDVRSRAVQRLDIATSATVFTAGSQVVYTATATYTDGRKVDVTRHAEWTIDNHNVAILADSTNQPGQVVAVDTGSTTIKATFQSVSSTPLTISVP